MGQISKSLIVGLVVGLLFFSAIAIIEVSAQKPEKDDDEKEEKLCGGEVTIKGTKGDDLSLYGTSGDDNIKGKKGDDVIRGYQGDDVLRGGPGDDILYGVCGGKGNDWIDAVERGGEQEPDVIVCGKGDDVVKYVEGIDIIKKPKNCEVLIPV